MSPSTDPPSAEFYARTYDESVPDWPGEIDFYRGLASEVKDRQETLLEIACGTGRVTIRLARDGVATVGLDLSPNMLEVAREKSRGIPNLHWVQADMCAFDLGQSFGLVIIPGHSFQNLNTPEEQVACMECLHRHLNPGGILVVHLDHQDMRWLGDLVRDKGGVFEPAEQFQHARTGQQIRASRAWSYEPASQTATCTTVWEALGTDGQVVDTWKREPIRMHCVFRFEVVHLLARVGFILDSVYGDFFRTPLADNSTNMVGWRTRLHDMKNHWEVGENCVLRGIVNNQVWLAQSVIVVKDAPQETVLLLLPGAQCAIPAGYLGWRNKQIPGLTRWQEARHTPIVLREFSWQTNRLLIFLEPEKYYSCFLFWDHQTGRFGCYYINFQLPYRCSHCGFDTLDLDLDIVIDPQYHWNWKDVDEYQIGIQEGGIQDEWVQGIERSQTEVFDRISRRKYPLDGSWLDWLPDPGWFPPRLPEKWRVV